MSDVQQLDFSYFPGCSLATTAAESNRSLMQAARILGFNLIELEDWNCCGATEYFSISKTPAYALIARTLGTGCRLAFELGSAAGRAGCDAAGRGNADLDFAGRYRR